MEVFGRPAVEAALVRQQVVELLDRHLEARHVGWLSCLDPVVLLFVLHAGGSGSVRREQTEKRRRCRFTGRGGGLHNQLQK